MSGGAVSGDAVSGDAVSGDAAAGGGRASGGRASGAGARLRVVHGPLSPADADAVRALAAAAQGHDGVEPLGEQTLLDLAAPDGGHVLADGAGSGDGDRDRDGTLGPAGLAGYAQLGPARAGVRTAELVVAPAARGAGLGAELLGEVLRLGAGDDVRLWAHGTQPAAAALARRAGLTPVRELWRMGRALDPADAATDRTLPPGVTLRAFDPARDEAAWLAANATAFAWHPEQGALTLADLRAREAEPWFDPADLLLAEREGALVGFAWLKRTPPVGELYVLGVVPAAQGGGLGGALTAAALAHLRGRGDGHVVLFTDAGNDRAVRTYRAAGFVVERADTQYART